MTAADKENKQTNPDDEWYRVSVVECPNCKNLQRDYTNMVHQEWHGCTEHKKTRCSECGWVMWVPQEPRGGFYD